jgi:serine/threonine protein kinase/Flp pilus assembly protein TadD
VAFARDAARDKGLMSRDSQLADLFEQIISSPPHQRAKLIAASREDEPSLAHDLESLLSAHEGADSYFEQFSRHVLTPAMSAVGLDQNEDDANLANRLKLAVGADYSIQGEIGGGGMSRVFIATEVRLGRKVVIKTLPQTMPLTVSVERFRREIQVAARLQNSHIVPVLTTGAVDGLLYYVMPYVEGETLRTRLSRVGALPVEDAIAIWRDVLDAIGAAHLAGIVHRDIKPENILLSGRNALVADFGIARAVEASTTGADIASPGVTLGTPAYMAPEQMLEEASGDHRIDIYAAGLVMYEMLAGKRPFSGLSLVETIDAQRTRVPPSLSRQDLPLPIVTLVKQCIEKDPAARPASVESILEKLDRAKIDYPRATNRRLLAIASVIVAAIAIASFTAFTFLGKPAFTRNASRDGLASASGKAGRGSTAFDGGLHGKRKATTPERYTPNIGAYEWYLRGVDVSLMRTKEGRAQALEYFNKAIALDPKFAAAYAGLASVYLQIGNGDANRRELFARSESLAVKAVALDDSLAEPHVALGWVLLATGKMERAEAELKAAVALNPDAPRVHEGLARLYMETGRTSEQLAEARAGLAGDPLSYSAIREMALALNMNKRCDESLKILAPLKALTPPAVVAGVIAGQCYAYKKMWPQAISEFQWARDHGTSSVAPAFLAYALARAGREVEARKMLSDMLANRTYSRGAFGIGIVYAGLRDYDRAFEWLEKGIGEAQSTQYIFDPMFEDLHHDPRFARLNMYAGFQKR